MQAVIAQHLTYSYLSEENKNRAIDDVSFQVREGEFLAILGHNGCGKTTLARHLNALLFPQKGELVVAGLDALANANIWKIRKACGMVFQNPDNQFVSSVVDEDLSFGLRNFGISEEEIPGRVKWALETVGMAGYEKQSTHFLSGGQKQRVAIAGVLAVEPDILIFDEVTSMLDPEGRRDVLNTMGRLRDNGKTIIMISHYIEEAVMADRIVLLHDGKILGIGTPREILPDLELLNRTGLTPPMAVKAYYDLKEAGIELSGCPLTKEELVEKLCQLR